MAYDKDTFHFTHLLQRGLRRLKPTTESTATGGSTTTVVDTELANILLDANEDDFLNRFGVFITKDAGGAGAAPEGEYRTASDYDDAGTITVPTAFSAAVASGDEYMLTPPDFPLVTMKNLANDALEMIGRVPVRDTSITSAANQTEYTLPTAAKGLPLVDVEIQGITTDANDNRWVPVPGWEIQPAAGGSTGTLIIPQYPTGHTVGVVYLGTHPRMSAYDDFINEYIHPELAVAAFVAKALEWYNRQIAGVDDFWRRQEDRAWNQYDIAQAKYPVVLPQVRFPVFPSFDSGTIKDEFPPIPYP